MQSGTQPSVFVIGNDIYVSPNAQRAPTATELERLDEIFSDPLLPTDALHLRYACNKFPYLAFVTPHPRYKTTILKPLDYSRYSLPIKMIGGQYCLEPGVAASWNELEVNLGILAAKLLAQYTPHITVDFETFPPPRHYGYHNPRHTQDGMRRAAIRAQKAFTPLMAMCSYAIAMSPKFTDPAPAWVAYVGNHGAHPRWLQELRRTPIVDFSKQCPRMGCVLKVDLKCNFLQHISKFVQANVPVWLLWNQKNDYANTPCKIYQPSEETVADAKSRANGTSSCNPGLPCALPIRHNLAHEDPPEPEPHSGQRKGETMQQFMERRAKEDLEREQKETAQQQTSRMQRLTAAATYSIPGRSGARVFEWEAEGTYWIRKAMSRGYVEQQWGSMAHGHLRYNAFRNEWDYCELFDPGAEPPEDDDSEDILYDYFHGQDVVAEGPPQSPGRRRGVDAVSSANDAFGTTNLRQSYIDRQSGGGIVKPEPLDVILCSRYGFCGPPGPSVNNAAVWHDTRKTLSDTESAWTWPQYQGPVCEFVSLVMSDNVPPQMWDLDPSSASPITFFNDNVVVERITNGARVSYRITPRQPPSGDEEIWDLIVQDPITAAECLRRSHSSIGKVALVQFFCQTGRPFSTRKPIHPAPPPARVPRLRSYFPDGLNERHAAYVPDLLDYLGYVRDRSAFCLSDRCRAAIKEGGIVWRLAVGHLRMDDILAGPVDLAAAMYERFDGDAEGGWDDQLTENELNLMSGVYKIFTGPGVYQEADASWWPKNSTWKTSALDVGYWSPTCEEWYQRRLAGILDGSAKVKSATKWRDALKLHKESSALVKVTRQKCALLLKA